MAHSQSRRPPTLVRTGGSLIYERPQARSGMAAEQQVATSLIDRFHVRPYQLVHTIHDVPLGYHAGYRRD
jgi:hypothetical protein